MTWQDALELVISRTSHERYRSLCDDAHPDHQLWRSRIIELADPSAPVFPPITTQAVNFAGAVTRVFAAAAAGQPVRAGREEQARRWAVCEACPLFVDRRCTVCGCWLGHKIALATESCPRGFWEASVAPPPNSA